MNVSDTIQARSDQLNADDLIGNTIVATVLSVKRGDAEQPIVIEITGHKPYKPCKSMRRVLVACWGIDAKNWIGKSMQLYNDPEVTWGGVKVGGIRISAVSDIDADITLMLAKSRAKKAAVLIKRLQTIGDTIAITAVDNGIDPVGFYEFINALCVEKLGAELTALNEQQQAKVIASLGAKAVEFENKNGE